uniref:O-methylated mannose binding protein n=1 Tax=Enchytraeus japonensis TaxID=228735 RepID=A0A1Y1D5P8_9ANNE|nr:O-methylated mannose binding protein [Enchytraeus japonensis]BBA53798.1 O-methylated mannose binding protein [Enchytraeus japonensis]
MDGKLSIASLALLLCVSLSQAGVSYIRWGRSKCPAGNIELYKGYMTGQHVNGRGSGANFLCSPDQPKFLRGQPGFQEWAGQLYGVEFEKNVQMGGLFLADNLPSGELHNQDMLCVRCYVQGASDVFMLPGRIDCYESGYDLLYRGFLVSDYHTNRASHEYVCLDEAPEGRKGGEGNSDQGFIYPVQYGCGSLPCDSYTDGIEATCAVCAY